MTNEKFDVAIIGSGPAGLTAAIYTARGGLNTLVLTGDQPGGQPTITDVVENFPGFPDGIKGPKLMEKIQKQAEKFGAKVVFDTAVTIDRCKESLPFRFEVETRASNKYPAKSLIIATGASPKWLDVSGTDKFKGRGLSVCATCDGPIFKDKNVALVGGGDTALTEAEFLTKFAKKVFIIHRRENFRAQEILQNRVGNNSKVIKIFNSEVKEFLGEKHLEGIKIESSYQVNSNQRAEEVKAYPEEFGEVVDKNGQKVIWRLPVDGVFLAVGYQPNTDFVEGFVKLDDYGYIQTKNDVFTSREGVFAAGDCVDYRYRQNIVSCGMGCKAALETSEFLNRNS
jgi:thioredoxin reductase (NADPH)